MPRYVVSSSQDAFTRNAPTSTVIEHAFQLVPTPESAPGAFPWTYGHWVGPRARITRTALLISTTGRKTTAAWLYDFPEIPPGGTAQERNNADAWRKSQLAGFLQDNLQRQTGEEWSAPILTPYNPTAHGPLEWWQNGGPHTAGDTATRDAFDIAQQWNNSTTDNPLGPTTNAPPPVFTGGGEAASAAKWIAIAAGVVATAYVVAPLFRGVGRATSRVLNY